MILRTKKRLLLGLNVMLGLAIAAAAGAYLLPLEGQDVPSDPGGKKLAASRPKPRLEALAAYAAICERDLRRPLFDAKASPAAVAKPTFVLIGTAVDPGFSMGMFRMNNGEVRNVGLGQTIENAELIEIKQNSVTLKFADHTISMPVENKEGQP